MIKDEALKSTPWWAPRIVPPKGAPNVLLIITDDSGFGVPSTFGGVIPTPTMDRIAKHGKPVFLWNLADLKRIKWQGPDALTPGRHTVEFDFKYEGLGVGTLLYNNMSGLGRPGTGTLKVDGKVVATEAMPHTMPMILQWDEAFDVGSDTLTGVNDADYQPPFTLTAKLNKLTIKVDRPKLSDADIKQLQAGQAATDGK